MFWPDADRDRASRRKLRGDGDTAPAVERDASVAVALAFEEIHRRRPDESGHEYAGGVRINLQRRADLLGAPCVHHDHPLRQRHRLDLVVSHVHAGRAEVAVELLDLESHLHAKLRVEVRQRLIEKEHRRLAYDRASHGDPLALAAGELLGLALEERRELEYPRRSLHLGIDVGFGQAANSQSVRHVFVHAHVRIKRVVLEHHGDVPVFRLEGVHNAVADHDLARRDFLEPGDHAQQGRFAAAGRPDDDDEFAVGNVDRHAVDDLGAAVALANVSKLDFSHGPVC